MAKMKTVVLHCPDDLMVLVLVDDHGQFAFSERDYPDRLSAHRLGQLGLLSGGYENHKWNITKKGRRFLRTLREAVGTQWQECFDEREKCAKIAEDYAKGLRNGGAINACKSIAYIIRKVGL